MNFMIARDKVSFFLCVGGLQAMKHVRWLLPNQKKGIFTTEK
jgi:hypothetical protein